MSSCEGIIVYDRQTARDRGWYIDRYVRSFEKRGASIRLWCTDEGQIPRADFAVVRVMDPQLSLRLEREGIRCFNRAAVSGICNDKLATYRFAGECGTDFMEILEPGASLPPRDFYPAVLKPRGGHGGEGISYIEDEEALLQHADEYKGGGYILQKAASDLGIDVRVYILGGRIRTAMKRINENACRTDVPPEERLLSNYCRGGRAEVYDVFSDCRMADMISGILVKLPLDFGGIDFVFDKGRPVFNEIEDVVGARMLYAHTDIDIVDEYSEYILDRMRDKEK